MEKFYYCSEQIEMRDMCKQQCNYCATYFHKLECDRGEEYLKEWVENIKNSKPLEAGFQEVLNYTANRVGIKTPTLKGRK